MSAAEDQAVAPSARAARWPLPARIGINAIFLLPGMGGLDTYVRELVPELVRAAPEARFALFCSPAGERYLREFDLAGEVELVSHPLFGVRGLKALTELTVLGALAGRRVELLHSVALTAPLRTRAVSVVTIADVTWMLGRAPDVTTRLWRLIVPPVARRADRVIAISRAGAEHIVEHLHVPAERIDVTLLGHARTRRADPIPEVELRRRFALGKGPIVLMVGTRKPHKNLMRLLAAMPAVRAAHPEVTLVLAGNPTAHEEELRRQAHGLGLGHHVAFLPFVEPAELEGLYATASCFVLPSLNEGFGLPLLEAMGRGVPTACSNVSALPEVAGDAARYFDPARVEEIAGALVELLGDPALREELSARGRAREAQVTWRATAEATLSSYAR
ncbi:MAG TPA: glycosyltransferase family 1 protein, partial [Solirubrobacteraceae bacterium]|nr:glycosyltransferase family 1 protein [Solirubrobacteraceae bacterium]